MGGMNGFEDLEFGRFNNFEEFINELLGRFNSPSGGSGYSSYRGSSPGGFGFNDFGTTNPGPRNQNLDQEANLTLTLSEAFHGVKKHLSIGGRAIDVQIPPGVKIGSKIRLKGKGQQSPYGGQQGDLYLIVQLKNHDFFQLEGDNLLCEVPIAPDEAVLGAQIEVPTPEGSVTVNVPGGIRSGQSLRLKGKGWPKKQGRGDQMVKIIITAPKTLSPQERELYEKIRTNRADDPRRTLQSITL
jgi:curved DNA-binding protein